MSFFVYNYFISKSVLKLLFHIFANKNGHPLGQPLKVKINKLVRHTPIELGRYHKSQERDVIVTALFVFGG